MAVSSVSGREVDFAAGPYGTVKAALIHYIQGLAYQLAGKGIRANTVSPGNTFFEGGVWENIKSGNPDLFATAMGLNPTGRMGTPEEMARAIVFVVEPGVEPHQRYQPRRRRSADARRAVLTHRSAAPPEGVRARVRAGHHR